MRERFSKDRAEVDFIQPTWQSGDNARLKPERVGSIPKVGRVYEFLQESLTPQTKVVQTA